MKARRYEAFILAQRAEVALSRGCRGEALALARRGREIANETGPRFRGPLIHGLIALAPDVREEREAALAAGEALVAKGDVGHNHFWFRRYAIERALLDEDWDEAERQADALLGRTADAPLAYASCVATRAQVLARRGRGTRPRPTRTNLGRPSWSRLTNTFTTDGQLRRRERLHWAN